MTDAFRLSASEALEAMRSGTLTAESLTASCLGRITERDGDVAAWLSLNDKAMKHATACDDTPPEKRGRLHGIPIAVKDVIDTADLPTTHNSPLYPDLRPAADAPCVALLRHEGAIVLGKTDTTEFAAAGRDARTGNPHDTERTSGGSSAGSAAAVADGHVPLALGTQTGGSTIRPASFCGVFGYKPSFGLVSREGVKLYAISFDTVGWYGRSLADIALLAEIYGVAEQAPDAQERPVSPLRIGVTHGPYRDQLEPESIENLARTTALLRAHGHSVVPLDLPETFADLDSHHRVILHREGAAAFRALSRSHPDALHDDFHHRVENRDGTTLDDLRLAHNAAASAQMAFDDIAAGFDVVIAPSAPGAAPIGRKPGNPVFNAMWTLLRVPCLNIPVPQPAGAMPVGITATTLRYGDAALLAVAERLCEALGVGATLPLPECKVWHDRQKLKGPLR